MGNGILTVKKYEKIEEEKHVYKVNNINNSWHYTFIKRLLDIFISFAGLIFLLPLLLIISIIIKIDSHGPAIFKQKRIGRDEKEYIIYKFRSMVHNAEEKTGAVWARKDDDRITKIGKFIRKTRIDELPQLFNVLKGEMSLVGPRPERKVFTEEFEKNHPGFKNRLLVKPGITGLAQIKGGYDITPHQKLRLDLFYIEHRTIFLDIKILLKTITVVLHGHGAR